MAYKNDWAVIKYGYKNNNKTTKHPALSLQAVFKSSIQKCHQHVSLSDLTFKPRSVPSAIKSSRTAVSTENSKHKHINISNFPRPMQLIEATQLNMSY
jgi:hypothetical protein